ncbi:MAG: hypothetical protein WC979_07855 [Candidatus Pacearchaeota archaeon]|jgi:hypothetical protein
MYKNNFCVCIKDAKRNPLQEHGGVVTLPFDSEYFISLQNKHRGKRAIVGIKIDGKDAANIVLMADSKLDLERFLIGEDLLKGKHFKFVSLNDAGVEDPGDSQNGNIVITVQFEKNVIPITVWPYQPIWIRPKVNPFVWPYNNTGDPIPNHQIISTCFSNSSITLTNNSDSLKSSIDPSQLGATVKGSESNQAFSFTTIGELEDDVLEFKLRLISPLKLVDNKSRSNKNFLLGENEIFCVECGKILKKSHKFCPDCGVLQPK